LKNAAEALNRECTCQTLDAKQLRAQLARDPLLKGIFEDIIETRPNLFSSTTVYLNSRQYSQMSELIGTIESVLKSSEYQKIALARSPKIAQIKHGPHGVFMGYDFHLSDTGPKLIEINTNAGGGLLNLELAKAQEQCVTDTTIQSNQKLNQLDQEFFNMFIQEWKTQRPNEALKLIAIVDDEPEKQYLYPEFQLFEHLCAHFKIKAVIADPQDLNFQEGKLWFKGKSVDMVYNRLTDFYLEGENHQSLREAYETDAIVLTPSPYHHALYANKLNLVNLTDDNDLNKFQLSAESKAILLNGIPKTQEVSQIESEALWLNKKNLFFKPIAGFGSKATYRGDKLTLKVWGEILKEKYVAQKIIPPSQRLVQIDQAMADLKIDIRAYVYQGEIQLLAARLYAGQTTNFRTLGGGFAPVFVTSK
jgi:hypothetical protein